MEKRYKEERIGDMEIRLIPESVHVSGNHISDALMYSIQNHVKKIKKPRQSQRKKLKLGSYVKTNMGHNYPSFSSEGVVVKVTKIAYRYCYEVQVVNSFGSHRRGDISLFYSKHLTLINKINPK